MPDEPKRKVAISYAWKAEGEGEQAGKVEEFCNYLRALDVEVLRDVEGLKLGDSLPEFMTKIGTSDFLCVFLSEAYLKSVNCLNELFIAWDIGQHDERKFRESVKVWIMPDAADIFSVEGRTKWTGYWMEEHKRVDSILERLPRSRIAPSDQEEANLIEKFAANIGNVLAFFKKTFSPTSIDQLKEWAHKKFPPLTQAEIDHQISNVYSETAKDMDRLLKAHPEVGRFVATATVDVVAPGKDGKTWELTKRAREMQLIGCDVLGGIHKEIDTFHGSLADWAKLRELVGGLAVFSVDRHWVWEQRQAWKRVGSIAGFARHEEPIGYEETAHFLPILIAALADGSATIARVFGEPNPRHLNGPPVVQNAMGPDWQRRLKVHLIKAVMRLEGKFREGDDRDVDHYFRNTVETIRFARLVKRDPYSATGDSYEQIKATFAVNHPDLEHLLLIPLGESGEIGDVLPDYVFFFSYLHLIFQAIQRHLVAV